MGTHRLDLQMDPTWLSLNHLAVMLLSQGTMAPIRSVSLALCLPLAVGKWIFQSGRVPLQLGAAVKELSCGMSFSYKIYAIQCY